MRKSLLAPALLGAFVSAASAQSSVTIYGIVDLGIAKTNGGTATLGAGSTGLVQATTAGVGGSKAVQMVQNLTSRLGFRGNEDLGGGLSAQFLIEHRFNADTGAQNSATQFWNGRSTVQLSSARLGRVYLGREYTPLFLMFSRMDPFGSSGVAQIYTYQYAGYNNPDSIDGTSGGVRTSNTVAYGTPVVGGFSAVAALALSEAQQRGRDVAVTAQYSDGPLFVGGGFEKVYKGTSPNSARGQGMVMVAATYDFGFAKIAGSWTRSKTATPTPNSAGGLGAIPINGVGVDRNYGAFIGATVPVGPGNIKVVLAGVDPRRADNTRKKLGAGYDYYLSKRTILYADGAYAKEDRRTDNAVLMLGLRHMF